MSSYFECLSKEVNNLLLLVAECFPLIASNLLMLCVTIEHGWFKLW